MSIIKKSDVKNHLSTRASNIVLPFKPASQPRTADDLGSELHSTKPNVPGSGNPLETATVKKPQA